MRKADEPKETMSPEQDLADRAQDGDQEAYGALVERYRRPLQSILVPLVGDREQAEDLVQDTVLKAWKNLGLYDRKLRFSTWFFRIGVNLALSARRRMQLEARLKDGRDGRGFVARLTPPESPLESVLLQEDRARLRAAILELPERYRRMLEQRYAEGLSCQQIAEREGTTPNTVSMVLFRAKQRLRENLEES